VDCFLPDLPHTVPPSSIRTCRIAAGRLPPRGGFVRLRCLSRQRHTECAMTGFEAWSIFSDRFKREAVNRAFFTLFLISLAMSPSACGRNAEEFSGYITVALEANPTNLDPRYSLDVASSRITQLVFNRLVRKDRNAHVVPDLAVRWERPDPTTYVFHLRKDAVFHDGGPFTSADVAYTFRSILDPESASPKRGRYEIIWQNPSPRSCRR